MDTKKIATIVGILILVISLGIGGYFAYDKGLLSLKADPNIIPGKVKITNVSHDRFTVSWITQAPTVGSIIYGRTGKLNQAQIDDSDQLTGQSQARKLHHVTVTNLESTVSYSFKIKSGDKNKVFDDSGSPYEVKTAAILGTQPPTDLINGSVLTPDNKPAIDSIVFVNIPGVYPLSTQVKKDGSWLLNLSSARNSNLTDYAKYDSENTSYEIFVQGASQTSKVTILTANDSPIPKIVLGETYDFTTLAVEATPIPMPTATPEPEIEQEKEGSQSAELASQFPLDTEESTDSAQIAEQFPTTTSDVEILNPYEEYEELSTTTPELRGTGPANTVLTIAISGEQEINSSTTIDSQGEWTFTPSTALNPGYYELSIAYVDDYDETQTMTRNFVIAAAATGGTNPAFTATGSAEASPTATPTSTPVARKSMPSTSSGVPTSGVEIPTAMLLLFGLGFIATGYGWKKNLK
jgi:Big-like domain-containing protein